MPPTLKKNALVETTNDVTQIGGIAQTQQALEGCISRVEWK